MLTLAFPFVRQAGASTAPAPADGSGGVAQQQVRRATRESSCVDRDFLRPFRSRHMRALGLQNEEKAVAQARQVQSEGAK